MRKSASKIQAATTRPSLFTEGSAIERRFPIRQISRLAQHESWRKEVHRPAYHIHKWWAQRLGSVFRAITLGALADASADIWADFYKEHAFTGKVVLDPFMGSGTTLGECAKLGAKPIGVDINPVSSFIVKQALTRVDIAELERTFNEIEADVKETISHYYKTLDPDTGKEIPALYYFWVKQVATPLGEIIPLFNSYVFSKDAYPKQKPAAKIICPSCWSILSDRYDAADMRCEVCGCRFNPQDGPVQRQYVVSASGEKYKIKDLVSNSTKPPAHRLYAILALRPEGTKAYLSPTSYDLSLFEEAQKNLEQESLPLPDMPVRPGHNTNQARGYNYFNWRDFFNERQLLTLGMLLKRILRIENKTIREQFLCLFSSALEFNNMFCSFKGEGTGAVRHMFSHHILKPERTPLENSVWGTDKSSGTFSTLFRSRLLKAKQYLEFPFEMTTSNMFGGNSKTNRKINCSPSIDLVIADQWEEFIAHSNAALVLNGDGGQLPLPNQCVDAVITDPPYFDFVHYSELSDFFYAWLAPVLKDDYPYFAAPDSSHEDEVQSRDPREFATKLARVFQECHRVLRKDGLLTFSFHHSRIEGWGSLYSALTRAGFQIVAAHPIYAEMQGSNPKSATKDPILLDAILVCKKQIGLYEHNKNIYDTATRKAQEISLELASSGFRISQADLFVITISQALVEGSLAGYTPDEMVTFLTHVAAS